MPKDGQISFINESHLDLFWLGTFRTCLERGNQIIKQYIDRCETHNETYLIETVVFLQSFLREYPEYTEKVTSLWRRGLIDVGAAYVDVWCNLVLGESHIRNIVAGREWLRTHLDIDSRIAVHPDLPGIIPQVSQIYEQAGILGYVTARKIFHHGAVWRHHSPNGSTILFYIHPAHYSMPILVADGDDVEESARWSLQSITPHEALRGFPNGLTVLSGGAGDLADRETFVDRYGKHLEAYIEEYREKWPEIEFGFGRFSDLLSDYATSETDEIPELSGEIPSVWGVAADESVEFFQDARRIEGMLLVAERLVSLERLVGLPGRVDRDEPWYSSLDDDVFFARRDEIPHGVELQELWNMHVFVQDHNGGGKEGAQSEFLKRGIQKRLKDYLTQIQDQSMARIAAELPLQPGWLLFNPHSWPVNARVKLPGTEILTPVTVPSLSFRPLEESTLPQDEIETSVRGHEDAQLVVLESDYLRVEVSKSTGRIASLTARGINHNWAGERALEIYAVTEQGNDVTIAVDEDSVVSNETHKVSLGFCGASYCECIIEKSIEGAPVRQTLRLWGQPLNMLEVDLRILWYGKENLQARFVLPANDQVAPIRYGTAFGSSSWSQVVPGSGPSPMNRDEISLSDWKRYREIQGWLASEGAESSELTVVTNHPGFVVTEGRLEAVLFRTSPSCGDLNFYWNNSGELRYGFQVRIANERIPDVNKARWAMELLMPPVMWHSKSPGRTQGAFADTPLQIESDSVVLSAMLPDGSERSVVIRLFEASGTKSTCAVSLAVPVGTVEEVNLLGEKKSDVAVSGRRFILEFGPFEIKTIRLTLGS